MVRRRRPLGRAVRRPEARGAPRLLHATPEQRAHWPDHPDPAALAALAEWRSHAALAALALGGAWLKGVVIIESFMALRDAPMWLRAAVHGWLALLCGGLCASFLYGG